MQRLWQKSAAFLRTEDGPTATEYAVLLALISLTVLGTMAGFGTHVNDLYVTIATAFGQI
ncbi:MAG: Flp family type IVb pilin [Planctomycetes bacterium]|nr:Flp family type IVb pilin [Planctomycetota bacterium]